MFLSYCQKSQKRQNHLQEKIVSRNEETQHCTWCEDWTLIANLDWKIVMSLQPVTKWSFMCHLWWTAHRTGVYTMVIRQNPPGERCCSHQLTVRQKRLSCRYSPRDPWRFWNNLHLLSRVMFRDFWNAETHFGCWLKNSWIKCTTWGRSCLPLCSSDVHFQFKLILQLFKEVLFFPLLSCPSLSLTLFIPRRVPSTLLKCNTSLPADVQSLSGAGRSFPAELLEGF